MDTTGKRVGRLLIVLAGTGIAALVGWVLFVFGPAGDLTRLLGIGLTIVIALVGARFASNIAAGYLAPYNVAEVSVEGPIQRQTGGRLPSSPTGTPADAIVEQIESADADENAQGLIVHLNTPGGEVVPSDDIGRAVAEFDGPTIAYATDTCASGGYWIASSCDRIVAREGSIVGSIGVRASLVTASELLDTLGLSYERFVAGDFKDAGIPLREMEQDEREYLQGIVDDYYDDFIDRVSAGRDIDEEAIQETEAKVFLGPEAEELGLVDEVGTKDAVDEWLSDQLAEPVDAREFVPPTGLVTRLRRGGAEMAFAFGAGITAAVTDSEVENRLPRLRS